MRNTHVRSRNRRDLTGRAAGRQTIRRARVVLACLGVCWMTTVSAAAGVPTSQPIAQQIDTPTVSAYSNGVAAPAVFSKSSPANGATGASLSPTLRWNPSTGATSYEVCANTAAPTCPRTSWPNVGNVQFLTWEGVALDPGTTV